MHSRSLSVLLLALLCSITVAAPAVQAADGGWSSTRVTAPEQHHKRGEGGYPYRDYVDWLMKEFDLQPGDAVADIGAGDGWWTQRFAEAVGTEGSVHAGEVKEDLVEKLKTQFADLPQVKPYLCPFDSAGLPEDSCDLVFFSQVYHHIEADQQIAYLEGLRKTIKPLGRLAIIERYLETVSGGPGHGTQLSELVADAEQAGWALVRYELLPGTYHYLTLFVQKDLFPPEPQRNNQNRNQDRDRADAAPAPEAADNAPEMPMLVVRPSSRFAANNPFDEGDAGVTASETKTLYANSFLWSQAPALEVEEWIGAKPDLEGKFLLVEFWATWCPPCRKSIPVLNGIHARFKDKLAVIGISDETPDTVAAFANSKIEFYSAIDTKARMKEALGVYGIPHAIVVEPGGAVIWEGFPLAQGHELTEDVIAKILAAGSNGES
jgi:thiol-disulfide isomerase/thioredoxin